MNAAPDMGERGEERKKRRPSPRKDADRPWRSSPVFRRPPPGDAGGRSRDGRRV